MDELDRFRTFRSDPTATDPAAERDARARLLRQVDSPTPWFRRRNVRRLTLATGTGAVALAGLAALTLVAPPGGGPPVVERARAALATTGDEVLHVRRTTTTNDPAIGSLVSETWVRTTAPYPHRSAVIIPGHGDKTHQLEAASFLDLDWGYDEATNTLRRIDIDPPENAPLPTTASSADGPLMIVGLSPAKDLLEQGRARVVAETEVDGREVYKVEFPDVPTGDEFVLYVDRETYVPILEESSTTLPDGRRMTSRTQVTIERLPATPENLALLSLRAQYPDATVGEPTTDVDMAQGIGPAVGAP